MILNRLQEDDCKAGWLLDGFPRNADQAKALSDSMKKSGMALDYVIEIVLDRETSKKRIMGRRICENDGNHPNNIYIDAIKPAEKEAISYAASAAASFPPAPTIRTRTPSTSGTTSTTTPQRAPSRPCSSSKSSRRRAAANPRSLSWTAGPA
jgi:adenylate kinase family enzyme